MRSSSISVVSGAGWASGATPPMANPVCARTKSASARPMGSPTSAPTFASSTRFAPLAMTSSGRPLSRRRNTSDFAIWPTSHPTAVAAAADVGTACSKTTIVVVTPAAASASATRRALAGSSAMPGDDVAARSHLSEVLEVVIGSMRGVLRQRDGPEVAGEAGLLTGAGRQRDEKCEGLGARATKGREVALEAALAAIALARPGNRVEGLEARIVLRQHESQARQEKPALELHEVGQDLLHRPLAGLRSLAQRASVESGGQLGNAVGGDRERVAQLGYRQRHARLAAPRRQTEGGAHVLDLPEMLGIVGIHRRRVCCHRERAAAGAHALAAPARLVEPGEESYRLTTRIGERGEQRRKVCVVALRALSLVEDRTRLSQHPTQARQERVAIAHDQMPDDLADRPFAGFGWRPRTHVRGIASHLVQQDRGGREPRQAQLAFGHRAHNARTAPRTSFGSGRSWKFVLIHSQRTTPSRSSTTVVGVGTSSPCAPPRACTRP